jgi:translation initiation factor IF-2
MAKTKISKAAKDFNVSMTTVVEFLQKKGISIDNNPNSKIDEQAYDLLVKEYAPDRDLKTMSGQVASVRKPAEKAETPVETPVETPAAVAEPQTEPRQNVGPKVIGKIDLDKPGRVEPVGAEPKAEVKPEPKAEPVAEAAVAAPKEEPAAPKATPEAAKPEAPKAPVAEPVKEAPKAEPVKAPEPKAEVAQAAPKAEAPKAEAPKAEEKTEAKAESKPEVDSNFIPTTIPTSVKQGGLNINVVGKIDLSTINQSTRPKKKTKEEKRNERIAKDRQNNGGQQGNGANAGGDADRKKRKRIRSTGRVDIDQNGNQQGGGQNNNNRQGGGGDRQQRGGQNNQGKDRGRRQQVHTEVSEEDVQKQVKETLARLTSKDKGLKKGAKWRKEKREAGREREREAHEMEAAESKVLKLTEFVTANDLASMMNVPINQVIGTCMSIGVMVSINQRLDAETINIVAEEFGFKTEYVSAEVVEAIQQEEDTEDQLMERPPIVTVMGHVDHGKTSLLDYIRNANVIAGEAGGITQHIGAYNVKLKDGRHITFLDTPGHEAFTAMRARGAKVTDLCIIIVAADDNVMPQTVEAINHASAAGVPIVFAINKIDKPAANPDKIKEELAGMNYLVEEWGGKYQSQDISAKKGLGVEELMEKVLLEAEMLELKANPHRMATGSIIESSLDKGRGYVATVLVQNGTLRVGDFILAGTHYGKVKAMFNERNQRIKEAGPATPALILGLNGAPTAGDTFNVMESEQEAKEIANKREQLQRELGLRTKKILTLEDIGRRRAIGNFQELNIIVKGDVDGSIEALSDSLIKLSTEEIQINVLHKAVGEISESDVTLAAASDAIIIGFQVRPSIAARREAEREGVQIRLYSVIYQAIEEVKDAMEGMLAPELKEEVIGTAEVLQTYKISKVGTVAGCLVREGRIKRSAKIRLIREGIVRYTGDLGSLKRFKDDVKEVVSGYDCGLNINGYNDVREGDIIEAFEEVEVKKTL